MELGIFSPEIGAKSVSELFEKVRNYGLSLMQLSFESICKEEMPVTIPDECLNEISRQMKETDVKVVAVNGTFNMAHPDKEIRLSGAKRFEIIAEACKKISCGLVTICTGSRNTGSMWSTHPLNDSKEAWDDMAESMRILLEIAERYDLLLGMETEASNIINSPQKAVKIIKEMGSHRLKIIMDCANLFRAGMAKKENVKPVISEAFELIGDYVVLAHGKDIQEGDGFEFCGAGKGIVDFEFFHSELKKIGYKGGMILHGTHEESQIAESVSFLKRILV
jgi:sugar phosphate isomerase/epimerase